MGQFDTVVRQLTLFFCLWFVGCTASERRSITPLNLAPNDLPVFDDKIASDWNDWSYGATVDSNVERNVHTGERSIAVSIEERHGAVQLVRSADIYIEDFTTLRLAIHGGMRGKQSLDLALIDSDNSWSDAINLTPVARKWVVYKIPITAFGEQKYLKGIVLQDAGGSKADFFLDSIVLDSNEAAVKQKKGPALTVDLRARQHLISADIYGLNFAEEEFAAEIGLPINRWGGNAVTRYNWELDVSNRASDWFFLNVPNEVKGRLPKDSAANQFVKLNQTIGAESLITVPMIGWTPKSRGNDCSFAVEDYGEQQFSDYGGRCGNGLDQAGEPLKRADPTDTSEPIDEQYVSEWVAHLIEQHGTATQGGVRYYALDNEPMLWHITHRDVFPEPLTYEGLVERSIRYAEAVKSADPAAQILGPALWGWTAYFYSALDSVTGNWADPPDHSAHDDVPLVEFYLQAMADYQAQTGQRILDVLDLHYYPQGGNIPLTTAGGASVQAHRLRSTRSLWDWEYEDESWIAEPVALIPRMHNWVDDNYPGTKIGLTEYNWGGLEHINGALTQADVLGIFGRERLDMAMLWQPPDSVDPGAFAFRIYRNYDGEGSQFGEISLLAASDDQDQLSIYAAERSLDQARTVIVINKTRYALESTLAFQGNAGDILETYRYSSGSLHRITREADIAIVNNQITTLFPAQSITLFVLP